MKSSCCPGWRPRKGPHRVREEALRFGGWNDLKCRFEPSRQPFRRGRYREQPRRRCPHENIIRREIWEWCATREELFPNHSRVWILIFSASGLRAQQQVPGPNSQRAAVVWPSRSLLRGFRDRFAKNNRAILRL